MSFLDELKREVAARSPFDEKRKQIEALRKQAQETFQAQFLLGAEHPEKIGYLKGRLEAFDECLQLFQSDAEQAQAQRKWEDEEG